MRQLIPGDTADILIKGATISKYIVQGTNVYQLATNTLISGALNHFLQIINQLQIQMHFPALDVAIPSNAQNYFEIMLPIV